jgi:sugar lactone lactonase YvrE
LGGSTGLGSINPKIYPLLGTNAFRDITVGSNGTYSAGTGYDLCTGIGVPNIGNLVNDLTSGGLAPTIIGQLDDQVTVAGQAAAFSVVAAGTGPLDYQWQISADGGSTWGNLSDNGTYGGSHTPNLILTGVISSMSGDQFRCGVSNSSGTINSAAELLTVNLLGVTTLAGLPGDAGFADGVGRLARFNSPGSVRTDMNGNVYVADNLNDVIRKVTPGGVVTTVVGTAGTAGSSDGAALTAATLNDPSGVAIDASSGNLYIADGGNFTIRKVTPAGIVSTLAGTAGIQGTSDGTGAAAQFDDPENIAVDASGNLYVPDGLADTVRKITPAGVVTTLAGSANVSGSNDGTGAAARFNDPDGIAVDLSGNVYVADSGNDTIRKVTPAGAVTTLAGSAGVSGSADGVGAAARFNIPTGLAVDSAGTIYVADSANETIRELALSGQVTTVAGLTLTSGSADGQGTNALFNAPADVAVDANGILYVADNLNNTVRRIALTPLSPPQIATQPSNESVFLEQTATFTVSATGSATLTYQWQISTDGGGSWTNLSDTAPYSGSATPTLTITDPTTALSGAQFKCIVANSAGSVASAAATLTVSASIGAPQIQTQPQGAALNAGSTVVFTVIASGSPTSYQWFLNGAPLGDSATGATSDIISGANGPQLVITAATAASNGNYTVVATNSGGSSNPSATAALQVAPSSNAGLANSIATRAFVGTGNNILIGGFFIVGSTSRTVLVQGLGPALGQFGVTGFLAHPTLSIHQTQNGSDATLYSNTGWGSNPVLLNAAASVFASPALSPNSQDSELLLTLPPGGYSAEVSGADGGSGVALCAIYELP